MGWDEKEDENIVEEYQKMGIEYNSMEIKE